MKRLFLCLSCAAITSLSPFPALAQTRVNLQNLRNGDYVFKKPNSQYIVFRKTGSTLIGESFSYPSDDGYCFKGTAKGAAIVNAVTEQMEDDEGSQVVYMRDQTISLQGYRSVGLRQRPRDTEGSFKRCLDVMRNK